MLDFFPTPYPEELWFSVLCRYHIRTGGLSNASTFLDLTDSSYVHGFGALYPNGTLKRVFDKLPKGLFSLDGIILHHTLFPYFVRMHRPEDKELLKRKIESGTSTPSSSIWNSAHCKSWRLSYCPICAQEDKAKYGEAYWHAPHQIPLMPLCYKHHTPLTKSNYDIAFLKHAFCPMPPVSTNAAPQPSLHEKQILLTDILMSYWSLPYLVGPTYGYNNLITALADLGYTRRRNSAVPSMDTEKLFNDLTAIFGEELVSNVYGKRLHPTSMNQLAKWIVVTPERYALLQALAGISPEELFLKTEKEERIKTELLKLRESGIAYRKTVVAEQLGISTYKLESCMKQFGIDPFCGTDIYAKARTKKKSSLSLKLHLTEEELEQFTTIRKKVGFQYTGHFLWYCFQEFLKNHPEYTNNNT